LGYVPLKKHHFMHVLCLKTGLSPKKGYWMSIPSLTAAAFSPASRWGGWVAMGGGGKAAKQGKNPFTAKTRSFICRLPALQTSEHFLPFTKDVGF
jgi:hypothetical protein